MKKPRKNRPRRLQYETLERREVMAAGVTAALSGGVLNVYDTDSDDAINLLRSGKQVSIEGLASSWAAKKVKSIVVNVNGGNDTVSLNSFAHGGTTALGKAVTVRGGLGTDKVQLANGHEVNISGIGNTLFVSSAGVATLNGANISFSNAIHSSLASGVLTITATNGNDVVLLAQNSGWVGLFDGIAWFETSKVNSIVINLQEGNDNVTLDSLGLGANQTITAPVTINSGPGNKTVDLANGHSVQFSGFGHQLKAFANGTVTMDGFVQQFDNPTPPPPPPPPSPTNWFDTNIQDAALRTLGSSLYTDGLISRSDIISLLQNTKDGSYIDGTEIADLRRITDNATLFGSSHYLQTLTSYVAYGTVANTKYQGQALGNLGTGAASTVMDKLVNKWFLGLDRPGAGGTYRQFAGTLFVAGAAYADVNQGTVGDCYFLAALGEVALRSNNTITSMFTVNGDGTYGVKFRNSAAQIFYVTVDSYLPTNGGGALIYAGMGKMYNNAANELWVPLAEKAYAQLNEFGWSRAGFAGSGQNSYATIAGGYISSGLTHITGIGASHVFTSGSTSFNTFVTAWNAGKMIGFASYASPPAGSGVVGSHAYTVVGYNAAAQTVTLFNPWGIHYGQLTLSWAQIQQNFQYFDRTV